MKNYLIFIIVLLSNHNSLKGCGYSPNGEDIRYSFFLPEYFDYQDFKSFYYNANGFSFEWDNKKYYDSNIYDWFDYVDNCVPIEDVHQCLNELKLTDIHNKSSNLFVKYLFEKKFYGAIKYLMVAKRCESFSSSMIEDPWEREETATLNYSVFLEQLNEFIDGESDNYLKRKYAFLTIRTAYYGKDYELIRTLFKEHFLNGEKDYIYYWALYFNSFENRNADVDIANVMANSREKKYACYYYFQDQFNIKSALKGTKSSEDIANLYAFASVQRIDPNLDYLKEIYKHCSKSRILDFLLLREINKIEDWVYTPFYTNYSPSIKLDSFDQTKSSREILTTYTLRNRSEKDRSYAKELLNFVNAVDLTSVNDVVLWKAAEIQLLFITRDFGECLSKINAFEKQYRNEKIWTQIEKIKALCITSNQKVGNAVIKQEVKPIILEYLNDEHFLFALGRELEFKKNLTDGIALIALGNNADHNSEVDYGNRSVEWRANRLKSSGNLRYFFEYFDYIDFAYSADELKRLLKNLNSKVDGEFEKTIYSYLVRDEKFLKDLLGTKYIRENRLYEALETFQSIDLCYWDENYNSWERDRYADYFSFDRNPFYDFQYTKSFVPHTEKFIVTKLSITEHLIKYLEIANKPETKNKDYYYFLVANCYLNMTQNGHAWMMRRYSSSSDRYIDDNESFIDEVEYREGRLAQKYYHLAFENAKTDKFKALCLRMEDYAEKNVRSKYDKLKSSFPSVHEELSNCDNLEAYFKARRN